LQILEACWKIFKKYLGAGMVIGAPFEWDERDL
jgi:hypothetical protein